MVDRGPWTRRGRSRIETLWPIGFGLLAITLLGWVHPDEPALVRAVWGGAEFTAGYDMGLILVLVLRRSRGYR